MVSHRMYTSITDVPTLTESKKGVLLPGGEQSDACTTLADGSQNKISLRHCGPIGTPRAPPTQHRGRQLDLVFWMQSHHSHSGGIFSSPSLVLRVNFRILQ